MPDKEDTEPSYREQVARETYSRAQAIVALQESIAIQTKNVDRMVESITLLADSVAKKPDRRDVVGLVAGISFVTLLVVGAMFGTILRNQSKTRSILTNGSVTLNLLTDCTTPGPNPPPDTGHACYDRSLANQATAIRVLDCANEAVLRYYLANIPGLTTPPIRPQCAEMLKGTS